MKGKKFLFVPAVAALGVVTKRRHADAVWGVSLRRRHNVLFGSFSFLISPRGQKEGNTTVDTINFNDAMNPALRRSASQAMVRLATAIEQWDDVDPETRKIVIRTTIITITEAQAAAAQRFGLLLQLNTNFDLANYLDMESLQALGDPLMGAFAFIRRILSLEDTTDQDTLLDMFALPFNAEDAPTLGGNAAVVGYADDTNPLALSPRASDDSDGSSAQTTEGEGESRDADASDDTTA
ncbi:MAG: hypothetical protein AAB478_00120 [Patescibacteria group bacterium]